MLLQAPDGLMSLQTTTSLMSSQTLHYPSSGQIMHEGRNGTYVSISCIFSSKSFVRVNAELWFVVTLRYCLLRPFWVYGRGLTCRVITTWMFLHYVIKRYPWQPIKVFGPCTVPGLEQLITCRMHVTWRHFSRQNVYCHCSLIITMLLQHKVRKKYRV